MIHAGTGRLQRPTLCGATDGEVCPGILDEQVNCPECLAILKAQETMDIHSEPWMNAGQDENTGLWRVETVRRGTDVPTRGYEVAYCASQQIADDMVRQHNAPRQIHLLITGMGGPFDDPKAFPNIRQATDAIIEYAEELDLTPNESGGYDFSESDYNAAVFTLDLNTLK